MHLYSCPDCHNYIYCYLQTDPTSHHAGKPAPEKAKQPNIVLIVADDLGYSYLGCYGGAV